jgi:hypothetical protein
VNEADDARALRVDEHLPLLLLLRLEETRDPQRDRHRAAGEAIEASRPPSFRTYFAAASENPGMRPCSSGLAARTSSDSAKPVPGYVTSRSPEKRTELARRKAAESSSARALPVSSRTSFEGGEEGSRKVPARTSANTIPATRTGEESGRTLGAAAGGAGGLFGLRRRPLVAVGQAGLDREPPRRAYSRSETARGTRRIPAEIAPETT